MSDFLIDIPEHFYSDGEGAPFEKCVVCGKDLLKEGTRYVIEKAIKNYKGTDVTSTVYEYAMCMDCYMEMQKNMSEESLNNLQKYYESFVEKRGSNVMMINLDTFNLDTWLSKCFFTDEPVKEMDEYQIMGQFNGNKLVLNTPPMAIGQTVAEEMSELLSAKTKGEMDRFREQFLGPPPEIKELFFGKKLLLI
jgi:hypothetical protein